MWPAVGFLPQIYFAPSFLCNISKSKYKYVIQLYVIPIIIIRVRQNKSDGLGDNEASLQRFSMLTLTWIQQDSSSDCCY